MSILSSAGSYLGVDIGSTSIKLVELKKEGGQAKLVTYGFSESRDGKHFDLQQDIEHIAEIINRLCADAGVTGRSAVSALPTFSVFSSVLNLTNVTKKDIPAAVHWEAKKVIPLPLEDMILDWKRIDEDADQANSANVRVLLTGAPRTLVKKYIDIFKTAQLALLSLETETFSLVRSLIGNDKAVIMLVELGASTTDVTIVDKSIPMLNRSIDVGGTMISTAIANALGVDFRQADQFKYDLGVTAGASEGDVPAAIMKTISPIVNEIKYAINLYQNKSGKKTEKIVLSGGSALLPGLTTYLGKLLDLTVIIGDPWMRIQYPPDLKPLLYEVGPRLSVAIGLAMREIN